MAARTGRRIAWVAGGVLVLLLVVAAGLLLQGDRLARFALDRAGDALGLEITETGGSELQLRGTPTLVVRDVVATLPGTPTRLLTADRILLSLPWSTLRGRLRELDFTRIELNAPVLRLDALQAWLETRPPGDGRIPTLREGLAVEDGTLVANGWSVEGITLSLPWLHPGRPVRAHAAGRYLAGETSMPFDLHAVLERPAPGHAIGIAGVLQVERPGWELPARVRAGGTWQVDDDGWGIARLKLGGNAAYVADGSRAPFALGLFGPLRFSDGRASLSPLHATVLPLGAEDDNPIPPARAAGMLAIGDVLELQLEGTLPRWPAAWPALPPPLGDAAAETAFDLRYAGDASLSEVAHLALQRAGARANTRLRLPDITDWVASSATGSPLPPLDGTVHMARLEAGGAILHDVELTFDDPALDGE